MLESRAFNLFMAFVCYQLLVTAYYFQYVEQLEPCPLCIFQRIAVLLVGIWFLVRGLHNPLSGSRWGLFYGIMGFISAALGTFISTRHVYLQNLPEGEIPACGPALEYLVEMLPVSDVIATVMAGDGECAKVAWSLLGLSMPAWLLVFFVTLMALMSWTIYRHFRPSQQLF